MGPRVPSWRARGHKAGRRRNAQGTGRFSQVVAVVRVWGLGFRVVAVQDVIDNHANQAGFAVSFVSFWGPL